MKITYSAPSKVIFSGEHVVVYGKPAIISSTDLRLTFSVWVGKPHEEPAWYPVLKEAVTDFLTKKNIKISPEDFDFEIKSDVPRGMHMGSSAALSVASAAAVLELYSGKEWDKESINIVAYEIEKHFHGKPSGGDNSTSCFGGLIYFRKEFEFLKQISALNMKLPKNIEDHLYLIDSGSPVENTAQMVARVGRLYNEHPDKFEDAFNAVEKITKRIVLAIAAEDVKSFKQGIADNEQVLEQMEVSSPKTQKLIQSLSAFGVGKVTGGGGWEEGSGMVVFFADDPAMLEKELTSKKINFIKFKQDVTGVRKESTAN